MTHFGKLGFIGVGNMGAAIVRGVLDFRLLGPRSIWVADADSAKTQSLAEDLGVHEAESNTELLRHADTVVLAVKPQGMDAVLRDLAPAVRPEHLFVSIAAGVPKPVPYIIFDPAPNAFATGRNPEHSAVAATTGLLTMMNDQELEGVVGHEMSHIKNYDILLQTMTIVLVGTVIMLSDIFLRTFWLGDHDSGGNGEGQLIMMVIAIVFAILAPIIAMLIQLAISRRREYLADANGALLTRYPPGLASALQKIGGDAHQLRRANKATAHMYIAQPLNRDKGKRGSRLNGLFDTHPPIEDRIRRLDQMTGNFQEVQPGSVPAR